MLQLKTTPFPRQAFPTYRSWFQHPAVAQWLGDIDPPWLEHIPSDSTGREYAFYHGAELMGVVGTVLPDAENPHPFITNFAVNPAH